MSKAILVMDMPEKCSKCSVCHVVDGNAICQAKFTGDSVEGRLTATYTKPDWCPLVPMPEKYPEKDYTPRETEQYMDGYEDGYNAAIDAIGGNDNDRK